jgi:hypothetical protein
MGQPPSKERVMSLCEDLIATGERQLIDMQAMPGAQAEYKQQIVQLLAMRAQGLTFLQRSAMDLQTFAEVIQQHRRKLRPFVMTYPAAFGIMGAWETVMALWANTEIPEEGASLAPEVKDLLESLFTSYSDLIAN